MKRLYLSLLLLLVTVSGEPLTADQHAWVVRMCDYCEQHDESEVPDPYYGGAAGFEKVLDLLEDACSGFLRRV